MDPYWTLWDEPEQQISSAKTSNRKVPSVFKLLEWKEGTKNLDLGGGKYDDAIKYLSTKGVSNWIYDPYNRTPSFNIISIEQARFHTVTVNNVLNVISEPASRDRVIMQAAVTVQTTGTVYFTIHDGNRSGIGCKTTKGWQENRRPETYESEIARHFRNVARHGNIFTCSKPYPTIFKVPQSLVQRWPANIVKEWGLSPNADKDYHLIEIIGSGYDTVMIALLASAEPHSSYIMGRGTKLFHSWGKYATRVLLEDLPLYIGMNTTERFAQLLKGV